MFLFFLDEGEVFSWGLGYGGKLGQGHLRDRSTPLRVAALKDMKITTIACHEFHTAAVCGKIMTRHIPVATWGLKEHKLRRKRPDYQTKGKKDKATLAQSNFYLIVENCPDLR